MAAPRRISHARSFSMGGNESTTRAPIALRYDAVPMSKLDASVSRRY